MPSSASSRRTWLLMPGCATCVRAAALVNDASSAIATTYSSCRISIARSYGSHRRPFVDDRLDRAHAGAMTTTTNPSNRPGAVAERYFTDWMAGDFDGVRTVLADDVTFVGAL